MRRMLCVAWSFLMSIAFAHTDAENYQYVNLLMEMMAASPEWADCIDIEEFDAPVEVDFPTMASLFAYEVPTNMPGGGWSVAEKQEAFDRFLMSFSMTNSAHVSIGYESTGRYALICCGDKGYTNALVAARAIMNSASAPCKDSALHLLLKLDRPSYEMNSLVFSVATNTVALPLLARISATADYLKKLEIATGADRSVVTNAAKMFYNGMGQVEHLMAVDEMLVSTYGDYAMSSNRLDFCRTALRRSSLTAKERTYFTAQTNSLETCGGTLSYVKALE